MVTVPRKPKTGQSLAEKRPYLAKEWHPTKNGKLRPEDVSYGSGSSVFWVCQRSHTWKAYVSNRTRRGHGCPKCSGRLPIPGKTDLATTHPGVSCGWDYERNGDLRPENVKAGSGKSVWWVCDGTHSWLSPVCNRVRGNSCTVCSGQMILPGYNDLSTTHPDLAEEWHPTKNLPLTPDSVVAGTNKKIWWKCRTCTYVWEAWVHNRSYNRSQGNGCPACAGRSVLVGYNDLATTHPELAAEWHPTLNGDLKPTDIISGSGVTVWWRCESRGHVWRTRCASRSTGSGCPSCGARVSQAETELFSYVLSLHPDALQSDRTQIGRKELDIYIPSLRKAIEFDGTYFHSERFDGPNRRLDKDAACSAAGIDILHVEEADWRRDKQLVLDTVTKFLGVDPTQPM